MLITVRTIVIISITCLLWQRNHRNSKARILNITLWITNSLEKNESYGFSPWKIHIPTSTLNCLYSSRGLISTKTQAENSGPRRPNNRGKQTHFSNDFGIDKGIYLRIRSLISQRSCGTQCVNNVFFLSVNLREPTVAAYTCMFLFED